MTKKDYVLIAEAFIDGYKTSANTLKMLPRGDRIYILDLYVSYMVRWLLADNSRFDRQRFIGYIKDRVRGI